MIFSTEKSSESGKPYSEKQKDIAAKIAYDFQMFIAFVLPLLVYVAVICIFKSIGIRLSESFLYYTAIALGIYEILYFVFAWWLKKYVIDDNVNDLYYESIARSQ
jgi:hypothetical protein